MYPIVVPNVGDNKEDDMLKFNFGIIPESACLALDVIIPNNLPVFPDTIIPPLSPRKTEALVCNIIGWYRNGVTFATDPTDTVEDKEEVGSNNACPMTTAEAPWYGMSDSISMGNDSLGIVLESS